MHLFEYHIFWFNNTSIFNELKRQHSIKCERSLCWLSKTMLPLYFIICKMKQNISCLVNLLIHFATKKHLLGGG